MREFTDLGAGFRVAALDLEIRGAGNLLGGEQSGHIEAVGFEMYLKLLEQTIKRAEGRGARGRGPRQRQPAVDLRIDETYIPDMNQRLTRLPPDGRGAHATRSSRTPSTRSATATVRRRSRSSNLAEYASIRILADRLGVESIDREGSSIVFKFRPGGVDPARVVGLVNRRSDITWCRPRPSASPPLNP